MSEELKQQLLALGLTEAQVAQMETDGLDTAEELQFVDSDYLQSIGVARFDAKRIAAALAPQPEVVAAPVSTEADPMAAVPEGVTPSPNAVNNFAAQMGMDPSMMMAMMMGGGLGLGGELDLSSMVPVQQVVGSYSPKIRNLPYILLGQIERRLGVPIIVINDDGSVNAELTQEYVLSLEEGFDSAVDNIYYDGSGNPYEVIKVGMDAQSIYDADPLDSTRALQKSGMGIGNINWTKVPLDVRQAVYYAVQTGELNINDDSALARLRDKINPSVKRMNLRGDYPRALAAFSQAQRSGALPTLRVQLSRGARKQEIMPRRRQRPYGGGDSAAAGEPFRGDDE